MNHPGATLGPGFLLLRYKLNKYSLPTVHPKLPMVKFLGPRICGTTCLKLPLCLEELRILPHKVSWIMPMGPL